jgi:hypothetical protein
MSLTKTSMAILNTLCTDTFDKAALVAARCSEFALGLENAVSSFGSRVAALVPCAVPRTCGEAWALELCVWQTAICARLGRWPSRRGSCAR